MDESDFFGTASGNTMDDKFERTNMHAIKSTRDEFGFRVIGEIVNVLAGEEVLDENGKVDPAKLNAIVFDQFQNGYYKIGDKVGQTWSNGKRFMDK